MSLELENLPKEEARLERRWKHEDARISSLKRMKKNIGYTTKSISTLSYGMGPFVALLMNLLVVKIPELAFEAEIENAKDKKRKLEESLAEVYEELDYELNVDLYINSKTQKEKQHYFERALKRHPEKMQRDQSEHLQREIDKGHNWDPKTHYDHYDPADRNIDSGREHSSSDGTMIA